jgi:hypothetical protein
LKFGGTESATVSLTEPLNVTEALGVCGATPAATHTNSAISVKTNRPRGCNRLAGIK